MKTLNAKSTRAHARAVQMGRWHPRCFVFPAQQRHSKRAPVVAFTPFFIIQNNGVGGRGARSFLL